MQKFKITMKWLMGLAFIFAGINHFVSPAFYIRIMPDYIPYHAAMVYLSGVTEIIAGVMLLMPRTSQWGAWLIVAHLLVFFTVHIWMLQHAADRYQDIPVAGLWARLVFQFAFIAWAVWYTRPPDAQQADAKQSSN